MRQIIAEIKKKKHISIEELIRNRSNLVTFCGVIVFFKFGVGIFCVYIICVFADSRVSLQ